MSMQVRKMAPTNGWPINHDNGGAEAFTHLLASPGPNMSWFIDGFVLTGGGTADGFSLIRRSSVTLDAAAETITVGDNAALEPATSDFAIVFGIKAESTALSVGKILHKHDGSDDGYIVETTATGHLKVTVGDGTDTATFTSRNVIADGKWHLVIINIDAGSETGLTMYVDNVSAGDAVDISAVNSITGGATDLTVVGENSKTFYMSCIGLYKGQILSATERETLWANGAGSKFVGTETGISAAWNLDEGTGTTLNDLVGSNDGTIANATWNDGEGLPIDAHTLGKTIQYQTGVLNTNGVIPTNVVTFPHSIRIGRNNPVRIHETDGSFSLQLFGHADAAAEEA